MFRGRAGARSTIGSGSRAPRTSSRVSTVRIFATPYPDFGEVVVAVITSLLGAFLSTDDLPLAERLRQPFPWIEFLSPDSRDRFAEELVSVTRACASFGQFTRLLIVFEAWRSSAQVIASGYLPDDELHWIEDPVAVLDPRQQ